MVKFKTFVCHDDQMFGCDAFTMLIPEDWNAFGGLIWRQHPAMPGAVSLSVKSSDNLYALGILPSAPYTWMGMSVFGMMGQAFSGGTNLGNEVRQPPPDAAAYVCSDMLTKLGAPFRVTNVRPFTELEQSLRQENPPTYGVTASFSAVIVDYTYEMGGMAFEGSATCGIVFASSTAGTIWVADKMFVTSFPMGQREATTPVFGTMIKSFKIDLHWFNLYQQYVQSAIQSVNYSIYQTGVRSRIISNMSNQISDITRRSYEYQQASQDRVYQHISEGIRGVNSYYDPYKGYSVEFPCEYRYIYANPLGQYYATNGAGDNPNVGSNLNWTILNG